MARSVVIRSCFKKPLLLKLKGLRRASTNPFINFYLVYMENMYGCRCKVKGVSREAAKVWARMSHVEREPFIVMARQKRQRVKCCSKRSGRARGKRSRKRSRKRSSRRRCKPRGRSRRGSRRRSRRRSGRSRSRSGRRGRSRSGRRGAKSLRRWCTAKPPCVGGSASRKRSRSRRSCSKRSRRRSRKRPRRRSRKCGSRRRRSRSARRSRSRRRRSGSRRRRSKGSTSQGSWCTVQPTCKRNKTPPPGSGDHEDQ